MKAYEGHPARQPKTTPRASSLPDKIDGWCTQIPAEKKAVYPIDQNDGGEDDHPGDHAAWAKQLAEKGLNPCAPWTRQIDVLRIDPTRTRSVFRRRIGAFSRRDFQNVILMGVHVDICVAGRPFGSQMAKNGKHVALVRE